MEKVIEVRGLKKVFGEIIAVENLDLDVFRGEVFGFLGPNGAGKSTTIRMLLSLIKPNAGTINIFGKELHQHRSIILQKTGCIVEKPDFYKFLSAKKNLSILAKLSGFNASDKRINEILDFVGLNGRGNDLVKTYSHGMKQRLGLAQALIHDPELIILDEPTTGLDPQGIIDIRNLILHLSKEQKKTVFLSSHILSELELIATSLAIINKGKTVAQGPIKTLLHDNNRIVTIKTNNNDHAMDTIKKSSWSVYFNSISEEGLKLNLHLDQIAEINSFLVSKGFSVYGIESKRQLEDFFLKLTEPAREIGIEN